MSENVKRRRSAPLLWASGLVAAAILVLGVNGTLSSWTSAVINNDNNSAASANAVALSETGGTGTDGTSCDTLATTTNTASCTTVNKYAGTAGGGSELGAPVAALVPGGTRSATVTMLNDGSGSGTLTLKPGTCTNTVNDATGADTTAAGNLCDYITVAVSCTGGTTFTAPATTLTALAALAAPGMTVGTLAASASTDCTFTVVLDANAPASVSNQLATQPLVWTLTA